MLQGLTLPQGSVERRDGIGWRTVNLRRPVDFFTLRSRKSGDNIALGAARNREGGGAFIRIPKPPSIIVEGKRHGDLYHPL